MGKQAPHSRATPPLQRDEPGPTSLPPGHGGPHSELVAWLSFFQVSCSPRPETPVLGVGEPTFSAPLSHQCPEQVGA